MELSIPSLVKVTNLCRCCTIVSQLPPSGCKKMPANFRRAASEHTAPVASTSSLACRGAGTIEVGPSRKQVYNSGAGAGRQRGRNKEQSNVLGVNWCMHIGKKLLNILSGKCANFIDFQEWKTGGLESVSLVWPILIPAENIISLVCHEGPPIREERGEIFLVLSHREGGGMSLCRAAIIMIQLPFHIYSTLASHIQPACRPTNCKNS